MDEPVAIQLADLDDQERRLRDELRTGLVDDTIGRLRMQQIQRRRVRLRRAGRPWAEEQKAQATLK